MRVPCVGYGSLPADAGHRIDMDDAVWIALLCLRLCGIGDARIELTVRTQGRSWIRLTDHAVIARRPLAITRLAP